MNDELQALWALHALDERRGGLLAALDRFPAEREAAGRRLDRDRARLEALRAEVAELQRRRRQVEQDVEALEAEERRYQSQQAMVKKNEEYRALTLEIEAARSRRSDKETEVLVLLENEDQRQGQRPALERALTETEGEVARHLAALEAEEVGERARFAALEAERSGLIDRLPAGVRARYERIWASLDGRAVVPIVKAACGGCFRTQPPQVLQEARRGDRLLNCDGCGRLLVWPPGAD